VFIHTKKVNSSSGQVVVISLINITVLIDPTGGIPSLDIKGVLSNSYGLIGIKDMAQKSNLLDGGIPSGFDANGMLRGASEASEL
jgi:hypothetical protein